MSDRSYVHLGRELIGLAGLSILLYGVYRYYKRKEDKEFVSRWKERFDGQYDLPEDQNLDIDRLLADLEPYSSPVDASVEESESSTNLCSVCASENCYTDDSRELDGEDSFWYCGEERANPDDVVGQATQALKASTSVYMI